jgi:putative lipoprotein
MKKALLLVMSLVVGLIVAGCQSPEQQAEVKNNVTVTGTIVYRERIALPDNALVTVTLQDISLADAPAEIIEVQRFETKGAQVPLNFEIAYDANRIKQGHSYSISARIEVDEKLRFINDTVHFVINDRDKTKHVEVRLISVGG